MNIGNIIAAFFPIVHLLTAIALLLYGVHTGSFALVIYAVAQFYLLPPLLYRALHLFWPVKAGHSEFSFKKYSPWLSSYQLQALFIAVPHFESILRLVPGLYSAWLRLWGAKIGRDVFWTPLVEIIDRPFLEIADHVVIGHRVTFTSHYINPKRGESGLKLYVAPICLGEHSFLAAGVRVGPGVKVLPRVMIKYNEELWPDKVFDGKEK